MAERIIIDTDPGVDDALAILMALGSPELEVEALTTVFGNVDIVNTTRNASIILEVAGNSRIPVYSGAAQPVTRDGGAFAGYVHGKSGLGNAAFDDPRGTTRKRTGGGVSCSQTRGAWCPQHTRNAWPINQHRSSAQTQSGRLLEL